MPGSSFFFYCFPTSCSDPFSFRWLSDIELDPLSFWQLFDIMSGSLLFLTAPCIVLKSLFFFTAFRLHAQIPYHFNGSPTSCLDPLSFSWLFGIVSGSPFVSTTLQHHVWIPLIFGGFSTSRLDPLSFRWLSDIVYGSFFDGSPSSCLDPFIFLVALQHRVRTPFLFDDFPTLCLNPLSFQWLSSIIPRSFIISMVL